MGVHNRRGDHIDYQQEVKSLQKVQDKGQSAGQDLVPLITDAIHGNYTHFQNSPLCQPPTLFCQTSIHQS